MKISIANGFNKKCLKLWVIKDLCYSKKITVSINNQVNALTIPYGKLGSSLQNWIRNFKGKIWINVIFLRHYSPNEYLTIDEGMIPYNGNINFKVFNPDKPTKWGIKEYILCDSLTAYTL